MINLFFKNALLPDGWAENVLIEADDNGVLTKVSPETPVQGREFDGEIAVAGAANLHSHAFQRAMAGLGERMETGEDDFWSWRDAMYNFVKKIGPDDFSAIAAALYVEMLEAGYTAVGEFHYLHHQPDGTPYDDRAEMSVRLMAAAQETGIGLTLLPVFYAQSDFNGAPLSPQQARFQNTVEAFERLVDRCRSLSAAMTDVTIGVAPHSLRAVPPEMLAPVVEAAGGGPVHIHIAEQQREVDACLNAYGARPVDWLLDHCDVNRQWCLVHATHMTEAETKRLAGSGAVAGICPTTEANLGDGIFNGTQYLAHDGQWGIGSDSHIRVDFAEELRSFEYSQRLRDLRRVRLARPGGSNGRYLFESAAAGGAAALGRKGGALSPGRICDIVCLDADHSALVGKTEDGWLDGWIFAGDKSCISDVWVRARHMVREGAHIGRGPIRDAYARVLARIAGV